MTQGSGSGTPRQAIFTVDVEPDCPPYLWTFRGIEEGMPRLLDLMETHSVRGTFFTTADVARRYPRIVQRIVDDGHELASHGVTHRAFDTMTAAEAEGEIADSVAELRRFAPVTAFRAPYLRMPDPYRALLPRHGIDVDCSGARYKRRPRPGPGRDDGSAALRSMDASLTSSVLRMPDVIRLPYMRAMGWPLMLFVHPWEFVDLRRTSLRWDCRFRTGEKALSCLAQVFADVRARGGEFTTVRDATGEWHSRA